MNELLDINNYRVYYDKYNSVKMIRMPLRFIEKIDVKHMEEFYYHIHYNKKYMYISDLNSMFFSRKIEFFFTKVVGITEIAMDEFLSACKRYSMHKRYIPAMARDEYKELMMNIKLKRVMRV